MTLYNYEGHCRWAGNGKTPQKIGQTLIHMFEFLSKIYVKPPGCTDTLWIVADIDNDYAPAPLSKYTENFTRYIKSAICIYEGEPDPMGGYRIYSSLSVNPKNIQDGGILNCYLCDGSPVTNSNVNYFEFEVGNSTFPPDPDRVTYSFYRDALLGGVSIWAADWAYVRCSLWGAAPAEACGDPTFPYSAFHMPWMCYLSAERAAKVRAPAGIATERTPDGGLLMIAAETRLDPQNPEHMMRSKALAELLIEHVGDR